ncbi:hypothetical protein ACF1GW_03680 [Streptomyces achromogenes]|uniref:hypothetical protein n=1 Tax=Streptomyces achromogenes TaxID=67255 RepID=UPI0037017EDB
MRGPRASSGYRFTKLGALGAAVTFGALGCFSGAGASGLAGIQLPGPAGATGWSTAPPAAGSRLLP